MYTFNFYSRVNKLSIFYMSLLVIGSFFHSSITWVTSSQDEHLKERKPLLSTCNNLEFPCSHTTNTFYAQMMSTQLHSSNTPPNRSGGSTPLLCFFLHADMGKKVDWYVLLRLSQQDTLMFVSEMSDIVMSDIVTGDVFSAPGLKSLLHRSPYGEPSWSCSRLMTNITNQLCANTTNYLLREIYFWLMLSIISVTSLGYFHSRHSRLLQLS